MNSPDKGARNGDFLVDECFHDAANDLVLRTRHLACQLVFILTLQVFTAVTTHTHSYTQASYGLFSTTTSVNHRQKDKSIWILIKQETMGWQWHLHFTPDI